MENKLVVGILNIVEDKLREFGIQIPDDDRDGSTDPIVGYQYAELHDRILEYLEEQSAALLHRDETQRGCAGMRDEDGFNLSTCGEQKEDLREVCVLTCVHETKYGTSVYGSVHATSKEALDYVDTVKEECDFEENVAGEYFNADIDFDVIDISKLQKVKSAELDLSTLDEQIQNAESLKKSSEKGVIERDLGAR